MPTFYPQILNAKQAKIFPQLSFLKKAGFYLAGGTACALQIGHRTSLDFDFYNPKHFSASDLFNQIETRFKNQAKKTGQEKDTLFCLVDQVDLSFFWYKYPLIEKPLLYQGISITGLKDIAAMKLLAISHRPAQRDYIDVYYLLSNFSLKEMFIFAYSKYPNFNSYLSLRALTYFEDIKDNDQKRIKILDHDFSWEKVKEKILQEVNKYQLAMIKSE